MRFGRSVEETTGIRRRTLSSGCSSLSTPPPYVAHRAQVRLGDTDFQADRLETQVVSSTSAARYTVFTHNGV